MKKLISFLIIIVMLVTAMPLSAFAGSGFEFPYDNLLCEHIYVKETTTGNLIFTQDENERTDVSSLTMIMTAIIVLEAFPDPHNTTITLTEEMNSIYDNFQK